MTGDRYYATGPARQRRDAAAGARVCAREGHAEPIRSGALVWCPRCGTYFTNDPATVPAEHNGES